MTRVHGSIEIDRPVAEVFAVLADQRNEVRYNPAMRSSTKVSDGPLGVGTTFEATLGERPGRKVRIVYTAYEPPSVLGSRSVAGPATIDGTVRCAAIGDRTRLSWDWQVRLGGLARLATPLVGLIGRRQERRIWTGLKRFAEEEAGRS